VGKNLAARTFFVDVVVSTQRNDEEGILTALCSEKNAIT